MTSKFALCLAVACGVLGVDAGSKAAVLAGLPPGQRVVWLGGLLTFQLYRNPGAAFGVGASYTIIIAAIAVGTIAYILRAARRLRSTGWAVTLGLLLGGAAGNLLDRLVRAPGPLRGYVIDWIKLPLFPPTFNLADTAITFGAVSAVLLALRGVGIDGSRTGGGMGGDTAGGGGAGTDGGVTEAGGSEGTGHIDSAKIAHHAGAGGACGGEDGTGRPSPGDQPPDGQAPGGQRRQAS